MPVIRDHEQKTGKTGDVRLRHLPADPDTMMRNHDLVAAAGGNAAVVNINSIGHGGMSFLRKRSALCLHAHRNGWDLLTRHPGFGIDFRAYQKIWRLLGVDQFQINGIRAKYWEPDESFVRSFFDCMTPIFSPADRPLPVVCSGQWGGQAVEEPTRAPAGPRPHVPWRRRHPRPSAGSRRRRARHPAGLGRRPDTASRSSQLRPKPPRTGRLSRRSWRTPGTCFAIVVWFRMTGESELTAPTNPQRCC